MPTVRSNGSVRFVVRCGAMRCGAVQHINRFRAQGLVVKPMGMDRFDPRTDLNQTKLLNRYQTKLLNAVQKKVYADFVTKT